MLSSRSYLNQLNLYDNDYSTDDDHSVIPRVCSVLSDSAGEPRSAKPERRVIVANQLPIKATPDPLQHSQYTFNWDEDALVLQLKAGFPPQTEVVYVGSLAVEIDPKHQDDVAQHLLDEFNCVPTFLSQDLINKFYHGFCKHFLWPVFHYMLPLTPHHGVRFDKSMWQAYVSANRAFADKVMEVINPDEDYVWVHDYHLMILPTFLRKRYNRVKLGFFLHSPFPSSEIYRTLPVREDILKGLLNCDLIGFHTFDYARHFLSCCSRMLGLEYQSKRGYIGLDYYGRTVSIKILPVGIDMGQIEGIMALDETNERIGVLKKRYEGKVVVLGVDDLDMFKGLSQKFEAVGVLLEERPGYRGKVVLVQILNAPRSRGRDIQEVQEEIGRIAREVNERFGDPATGYEPIVIVNGPVSFQEKVVYYAVSDCVVVNAVRDGMNLVPYKYTAVRQGLEEVGGKGKGLKGARKSVIIVSEFIGCSPSLSGAIRVNPWDVSAVAEALATGVMMPDCETEMRHEKHYKYIKTHDVEYWARSFDQDLKRACDDHYRKRCWGIGLGLNARVVALGPNFRKLSVEHIVGDYREAQRRLILLDYDGTMWPQDRVDKSPGAEVITVLNSLCSDRKNVVFIVSGRGRESLSKWFSDCERLGLSAEHGYLTRWNKNAEWESARLSHGDEWKKMVLPVMEHYTEATDGSTIEAKESALVWHYQEADPDFGSWQAKELQDHLESVLANDPVVVTKGQQIVEAKPQGVSKGVAVKSLVSAIRNSGQPADFVLCVGDDRSDEDMFEVISKAVTERLLPDTAALFACTVGQKPSSAKYYLDDTCEVMKMLQGLSAASAQQLADAKPPHQNGGVTFERSVPGEA